MIEQNGALRAAIQNRAEEPDAESTTRRRWTIIAILSFLVLLLMSAADNATILVTILWVVWLVAVLGPPVIRWVRRHWEAGAPQ